MRSFRVALKLIAFALAVVSFFLTTLPLYPFYLLNPKVMRPRLSFICRYYCKLSLQIFRMDVGHGGHGDPKEGWKDERGRLIVSNHLSYLDVLALASQRSMCFVTSVEIKHTPFLGQLCQLGGCLFVERRSRKNLSGEVWEISEALKNGEDVCIFPEGTSTNGESVLRFKRPLFQSAIDAKSCIQPVTLNYLSINGERISLRNRDDVFWYGGMSFIPHLIRVCTQKKIHLYATWHRPLRELGESLEDISTRAREVVSSSFVGLTFNRPIFYSTANDDSSANSDHLQV